MAETQREPLSEETLSALLAAVRASEGDHGTKEQFEALVKHLDSDNEAVRGAALAGMGDLARVAHNRDILAALKPFAMLVALVEANATQGGDEAVLRGSLRSLANLAFENPFARDEIRACTGAIPAITKVLDLRNAELRRVACGCIANVASNHDENCDDFRESGALKALMVHAQNDEDENVQAMAIRALRNLCSSEANRSVLKASGFLTAAVNKLRAVQEDDNMIGELVALVQAMSETKTVLFDFVNEYDGIEVLLSTLTKLEDVPVIADVADFLSQMAEHDALRDEFLKKERLRTIKEMFLKQSSGEDNEDALRLSMGRIYASLSASDAIMEEMFKDLDLFMNLLKDESKDVQMIAAMTLGNFARTDEKVSTMIDCGVAEALVNVVKDTHKDLTVRHYCVSCLRNLSLPVSNKQVLFKLGAVEPTTALLSERMSPVLVHAAIGLLRSLLLGGPESVQAFLESDGARLLAPLIAQEETESDHVRYEACRLAAQLCKEDVSRPVLLEKKLYTALDSLLSAKWDVLMLEGAAGCALLGEHSDEARFILGVEAGLAKKLVELIQRESEPAPLEETKKVALKALATLCKSAKSGVIGEITTAIEAVALVPMGDVDSFAKEEVDKSV